MNKTQLIDAVAEKAQVTKKVATSTVNAVFDAITEDLTKGEKVSIPGFGTFEVRTRGARTGRNPATGEAVEIAESKNAAFKSSKTLKDAINKK